MLESEDQQYVEISLGILKRFTRALRFDVYVRRTEKDYTKIFNEGDMLDLERAKSYIDKGIKYFYVTEEGYRIYTMYVERLGEQLVGADKKFSADEAADLLKELSNYTMHEMTVNYNVDERSVGNALNVVNGCIEQMAKDQKNMLKIMKLMSHQAYTLKHCVSVSMFSVLLARAAGMESETNLKILGLGAFLHDLGVSQLTFDPEDEQTLTPEQRKEMWRHPELGKQLLDNVKGIRSEVLQIVMQHHEQPNGHGYPNGLRGAEIYYPAKIVAIADNFCAMITKRKWREGFPAAEAIARMRELQGKFDKQLLDVLSRLLLKDKEA